MNGHYKAYLVLMGLLLTVSVVTSTTAQGDDSIWFWAWRSYDMDVEQPEDQRGDLLAFTPDGVVNVLLENVFPVVLERVDENEAFVSGKTGNTYHLYYLTPTQAVEVVELFQQSYIDEWYPNAIYEGYAYFTPEILPAGENQFLIADRKRDQYVIFDTIENTTFSVDLRPWCNDDCVRVSADGRFIRYRVSQTDPMQSSIFPDPGENELPYQLYEYDTLMQTERLIHEQEAIEFAAGRETPPRGDCTPDVDGDYWYCELFLDDGNNPIWVADEKYIVDAVGNREDINPDWQLRALNDRWYFLDLDRVRDDCDPCIINVFLDGNLIPAFQFLTPPREEFAFWYDEVQMLSEQHLLPNPTGRPKYALSRSGELTELGLRACCADPISQDYYDEETGWMVVINTSDPEAARTEIWSTRPLERIASLPADIQPGVQSTFREYSLVLFSMSPGGNPAIVYSYIDEALYEFELAGRWDYIDAFEGGALLVNRGDAYLSNSTYAVASDGIYHWTPTEGLTLLIDGAIQILRRF